MEVIVKYIFIGKQKIVLCLKLRENQKEAAASPLIGRCLATLAPTNVRCKQVLDSS
jgi:hypothetical protein